MNKIVLSLILLLAFAGVVLGQSPEAVNYQAVARDGAGVLLANQNLDVRIGIFSGPGGATLAYQETHNVNTNDFGLFTLKIGEGTALTGTFANIEWKNDEHHMRVEVDNGGGYIDMGMNQLLSTPYAFHSTNAENATNAEKATNMALGELIDVSPVAPVMGDVMGWDGSTWAPTDDNSGPWRASGANIYYNVGYAGIGTNTPGAGLELQSAAGYGSAVSLHNTGGGTEWRMTAWTDGTLRFVKVPGTTFTAMMIEPVDGHVGIGTDAPDQALSVHTSSGISYIRVSDNTTGPTSGLRMGLSGSGNAYIINDEASKTLSLGTSGTTRIRINDVGYTGINETSPAMMLHVKQDISNRGFRIEHNSTTDYWDNGIGVTTKNYKFYYNGIFRADISSTDGAYVQSSDRRLKRDIVYMEPVLDKVVQLKPATYQYIDNAASATRSTGFVAQDVESLFPDLVRETDEGYKGLVYDGFAVISIKAIQELNEKINEMQREIDQLKAANGN